MLLALMYWYDTVPNVRPSIVQFTWWLKLGTFNGICTIIALLACTDAFPHCYSQWGAQVFNTAGTAATFPMAFPQGCYSVWLQGATLMATSCPGTNLQMLLDNGIITGKANYYANPSEAKPVDGAKQEGNRLTERFNSLAAVPEWAYDTVKKMVDKGLLTGGGLKDAGGYPADLDLSMDMLRIFVINDRAGLYD